MKLMELAARKNILIYRYGDLHVVGVDLEGPWVGLYTVYGLGTTNTSRIELDGNEELKFMDGSIYYGTKKIEVAVPINYESLDIAVLTGGIIPVSIDTKDNITGL